MMRALYLHDSRAHAADNAAGRCHWPAYTPLMLEPIGLTLSAIEPEALNAGGWETEAAILLLPGCAPVDVERLRRWVEEGGILIGWSGELGEELDELFGISPAGALLHQTSDFDLGAQIVLTDHSLAAGVASPLDPLQPLLVFSDARPLALTRSEAIARLLTPSGADTGGAAITARRWGVGWAFHFAFDLAKTLRVLHHGRPVDRDYDGDGLLRVSDAIVTRGHSMLVPYADALLFLLRNMLARRPLPFISPLPPVAGRPADVLFFWGGDDECDPGVAVAASRWMRERGLPYHANLMPRNGRFAVTPAEAEEIRAAGHEISLHFNFIDGFAPGAGFAAADVAAQVHMFKAAYGCLPICTVNHYTRWCGWVEPARWLAAAGVRADNTRIHRGSPPANPVNEIGFAFGTAYPFWFCDDACGGDRRLELLCELITAYEVGYRSAISGSAPPEDPEQTDFERLSQLLEIAAHYHQTVNMFYHPVYIARSPACRAAIDELLRQVRERSLTTVHMGNDALFHWWEARSRSGISEWEIAGSALRFRARCAAPEGMVVQVPLGVHEMDRSGDGGTGESGPRRGAARVAGCPVTVEVREEFGQHWLWCVIPEGEHMVEIEW